MSEDKESIPMMASGKVVGDYRVLMKYLEVADESSKRRALPTSHDVEVVRELINSGLRTLDEILQELVRYVIKRVDPKYASKAVKDALGIEVPDNDATVMVARQIAGWIIEIAERLGSIKIRKLWYD